MLAAASLELKVKKQSAHMTCVNSVAFSPDGTTIVSGSSGCTIEVWDAGASALIALNLSPKLTAPLPAAASLELKAEKQSAHSDWVNSMVNSWALSPDGKTIVSGSDDKTLKVWDAGASLPLVLPRAKLTSPTNPPPQSLSS